MKVKGTDRFFQPSDVSDEIATSRSKSMVEV